jgi:hypothetical protein
MWPVCGPQNGIPSRLEIDADKVGRGLRKSVSSYSRAIVLDNGRAADCQHCLKGVQTELVHAGDRSAA